MTESRELRMNASDSSLRKCAFVLPYYGRFPQYFQLFLNSCEANPDFDWLVFTDDHTVYHYPDNVHVHYETFADMQRRVREAFDFHPELGTPYKLCDLKPMYGYLFAEWLEDYQYWGYCDCDVILGKLSHFITDELLSGYDKLFELGHCSILRNTAENNERFMLSLRGEDLYRKVLVSNQIFTFDESYLGSNVNEIFREHGATVFGTDYSANTRAAGSVFQITRYQPDLRTYCTENPVHAIYIWDHGTLRRYMKRLGTFVESELMYMHFQRRTMEVRITENDWGRFKILPGSFEPLEVKTVDADSFDSIVWKHESDLIRHRVAILSENFQFWSRKIVDRFMH